MEYTDKKIYCEARNHKCFLHSAQGTGTVPGPRSNAYPFPLHLKAHVIVGPQSHPAKNSHGRTDGRKDRPLGNIRVGVIRQK